MSSRGVLFACLFAAVSVPKAYAEGSVVFSSDFEGTVEVVAPSACVECKYAGDIVGSSQGYSWDNDFPGTNYPNRLNLILGEKGSGCTSDPTCCCSSMAFGDWMTLGIVSTTGRDGQPTRAFYYRANEKWHNGPPDYTTARLSTVWGGTELMREYTQQYWIKWPSEVETSLATGDHWMSILEQNTGGSPYMVQYVKRIASKYEGRLFWQWRRTGGETADNATVDVPIDRWFKISMYFRAGTVDGRYKLDVLDGGVVFSVFDYIGNTGRGSDGASNFLKQYSDVAPLSVYYDDYVLYSGRQPLVVEMGNDGGPSEDGATSADASPPDTMGTDSALPDAPAADGPVGPPPLRSGCACSTAARPPSMLLLLVALLWLRREVPKSR